MPLPRRDFLQAALAAAGLAAPAVCAQDNSPTRTTPHDRSTPAVHADGKSKKYRTALIGCGWWGMNILTEAMSAGQSKVVALCDVDPDNLELAAEKVEDLSGDKPRTYQDFRELLAQQQVEIAIVATPDHWHALATIAALQAGAHVYVEKPTSHTIDESRAMLAAARQADRLVQVGLHRRVGPHYRSGLEFLRSGRVGEIGMVRAFCYGQGAKESPTPNSPPPDGMNWDLYCGPAPLRPFNRKIHPGGFRHFLDFANGQLGDWGVHWLDQVLAWTEEKYPRKVYATGGRPVRGTPVLNDKEQTTDAPDSLIAAYQFESFTLTWEQRQFGGSGGEKSGIGCQFFGTKGTFHLGWRDGWTFYPANSKQAPIHEDAQLQMPDGHNLQLFWADFLQSIAAKRRPAGDIESAHRATAAALLGMLSFKLGRSVAWDGDQQQCLGDPQANQLLRRPYRAPWNYPQA